MLQNSATPDASAALSRLMKSWTRQATVLQTSKFQLLGTSCESSCVLTGGQWWQEVSRKVLGWRLKALPYLYSAFYDSHTFGCPIARPLWFNFPSDPATLRLQEQWMMGGRPTSSCARDLSSLLTVHTPACPRLSPATAQRQRDR